VDQLLVALDVETREHAGRLADVLRGAVGGFKIGSRLFTAEGPDMVRSLTDRGDRVFLDLKFHDIPNTVASACAAAVKLGVWMMNVHASGGRAMLRAAREAVDTTALATSRRTPLLIGVTVLTSLTDDDLREVGHASTVMGEVSVLAQLARACGLDGVVCSAQEASSLRAQYDRSFTLVTPGIRLAGAERNDQARTVTPEVAIGAGADYLVIGRPITQAADPPATLRAINVSLANVGAPVA